MCITLIDRMGVASKYSAAHPRTRAPGVIKYLTGERALATILRHYNVTVCRFPPIAHLACCSRPRHGSSSTALHDNATAKVSDRCHNPHCHALRLGRRERKHERTRGRKGNTTSASGYGAGSGPSLLLTGPHRGKYLGELRLSLIYAFALSLPGARYICTCTCTCRYTGVCR